MIKSALLVSLSATIAFAGFTPNVRVDHQNLPTHICHNCAIAVGPGAPSSPPLYVVFQDDSCSMGVRADIWFQKSTDAGRTWLPADVLIRRGGYLCYPDITTDPDGNVFIIYLEADTAGNRRVFCVCSSDGGTTWSAPARIDDDSPDAATGSATIAADSAGNLFCAWNDWRTGSGHIWSSVSTDGGATWGRNVQVDDDTTDQCYQPDVFVQPGTNHYLVAAEASRWFGGHVIPCAFLYRSTDRGQTFQPGVQLDTFNSAAWSPHVVADRDHIICDYFGEGQLFSPLLAESRTFYTQRDTWGALHSVANLDSLHVLYLSGPLALSGDGRVHTVLIICDTAEVEWLYHVYYTSSSDHGVSWSDLELVDEDTTLSSGYPDIGADSAGHAYAVWPHGEAGQHRIWFTTNNPLAVAEQPAQYPIGAQPSATVARNFLLLPEATSRKSQAASLLDATGRKVLDLRPGANDVRALAPGVYFVRGEGRGAGDVGPIRKVVVTR